MYAQDQAGTESFLVDGGFTDWTQQLLSNRKERLLISSMGVEHLELEKISVMDDPGVTHLRFRVVK